jgi:hypothetical protein
VSGHGRTLCPRCRDVVAQCRCPENHLNTAVGTELCAKCKATPPASAPEASDLESLAATVKALPILEKLQLADALLRAKKDQTTRKTARFVLKLVVQELEAEELHVRVVADVGQKPDKYASPWKKPFGGKKP